MTLQRTFITTASAAALSLSGVVAAFAHAHLVRATPAEGGTVKSAPVACGLTILQEAWSISDLSVNAGIDVMCPFAEMTADAEIIEKSKR